MALQIDVAVALLLRVDLPASLDDAEARRLAEAEALRRARGLRGAVAAEILPAACGAQAVRDHDAPGRSRTDRNG